MTWDSVHIVRCRIESRSNLPGPAPGRAGPHPAWGRAEAEGLTDQHSVPRAQSRAGAPTTFGNRRFLVALPSHLLNGTVLKNGNGNAGHPHMPTQTLTRRLAVVHLWPAVPTAAKRAEGTTKLRSASSKA